MKRAALAVGAVVVALGGGAAALHLTGALTKWRMRLSGKVHLPAREPAASAGGRIKVYDPSTNLVETTHVGGSKLLIDRDAHTAWRAMRAAFKRETGSDRLGLYSAARSDEVQERKWKTALERYGSADEARKHVAPPGTNSHRTGRAIDMDLDGSGPDSTKHEQQRRSPAFKWLAANAARFGFVNYPGEAWHWEFNPPAQGVTFDAV